jgi:hypothetical protein
MRIPLLCGHRFYGARHSCLFHGRLCGGNHDNERGYQAILIFLLAIFHRRLDRVTIPVENSQMEFLAMTDFISLRMTCETVNHPGSAGSCQSSETEILWSIGIRRNFSEIRLFE